MLAVVTYIAILSIGDHLSVSPFADGDCSLCFESSLCLYHRKQTSLKSLTYVLTTRSAHRKLFFVLSKDMVDSQDTSIAEVGRDHVEPSNALSVSALGPSISYILAGRLISVNLTYLPSSLPGQRSD